MQLAQTCAEKTLELDREMEKYGEKLTKCAYDAVQWKLKEAEFKAKALEEGL
nr:MAG TPA: hypothetical protein [Caudoviricetes sp.]